MKYDDNEIIVEYVDNGAPKPPIAALVLSILSIVFCWVPLIGLILAVVGLVLGINAKKHGTEGGMLVATYVCSIIGIVLGVFVGGCIGCTCVFPIICTGSQVGCATCVSSLAYLGY